ncbi:MAG: ACT domain-containing protein [Desulfobacterium sp.]|jgi:glycine cleavage system transcriptional repressor|nr:ACT domain-containing protein [Desulfobacterium sp.]
MNKLIITILGKDRPGIIAATATCLYKLDCNLENVNQVILQNQFSGIFLVLPPPALTLEDVKTTLEKDLAATGLHIHVDLADTALKGDKEVLGEDFIFTTIGPDQKGLVARFTRIIADANVNVKNLRAVFKGGNNPQANIMVYEVELTPDIDHQALFSALRDKARELGLDISIHHKNIFQAINKI